MDYKRVVVLGGGSWGTTLAVHLARIGHSVRIWEFFREHAEVMQATRENRKFLPKVKIPESIEISSDSRKMLSNAEIIVTAVPTHVMRATIASMRLPDEAIVVNASKGIENDSLLRMSEVISENAPNLRRKNIGTISGPSHAEEVSRKVPTVLVSAFEESRISTLVQKVFSNEYLRVYHSNDLAGVEIAAALKNVIAIASGICDGAGLGDNSKAALVSRGAVEIQRLGTALGAKSETFYGVAGMGDLIVTCFSKHSRNRFVGEEIGKGRKLADILDEMTMVAEGVKTAKSAHQLMKKTGVEMPILEQMYQILFRDKSPLQAVKDLMTRPLGKEF